MRGVARRPEAGGVLEIEGIPAKDGRRRPSGVWTLLLALVVAAVGAPASAHATAAGESRYLHMVFGGWELQHNLVYGSAVNSSGERQSLTLDLYQPAGDVAPLRPVVIYAHGGAFTKGTKESGHDAPYAETFARRGFVAASIDYRLDGSEQEATDDMQASVR